MNVNNKLKQRGDTIIEVLIAMTVASSVLGIAYGTANRNLLMTRASQERSEAARLIQGQIESLSYVSRTALVSLPDSGIPFCLKDATVVESGWGIGVIPNPDLTLDIFGSYPPECINGFYNYVITRDQDPNTNSFHFYVRWENVAGGKRDQIIMVYRVK